MADLALNLAAVAKNAKWSMQAGIIKQIIETSPVLGMLPVRAIQNIIHTWRTREKLPKIQTRKLGKPFSSQDVSIKGHGQIGLSLYGGAFELDRQLADIPTVDGENEVAEQIADYFESASMELKRVMIKGNASSGLGECDGLEVMTPKTQTIDFVTAAGLKISAATVEQIVNYFEAVINACIGLPSALLLDRSILTSVRAKSMSTGNERLAELFMYKVYEVPGVTGEPIKIRAGLWDGTVPMIPLDEDAQGVQILKYNEKSTDKANSDCTSIYAVMFQPRYLELLQKYSDGPRVFTKVGDVGPRYDIDFPLAFFRKHIKAVARLRNIRTP